MCSQYQGGMAIDWGALGFPSGGPAASELEEEAGRVGDEAEAEAGAEGATGDEAAQAGQAAAEGEASGE